MSVRLFVAIDVGAEVAAELGRLIERLRPQAPNAKWVAPENVHVTLSFLGNVSDELLPSVERTVTEVAARHPPHVLRVHTGGAFGSRKRPRVLWVGIEGEVDRLVAAQGDLAEALRPLGFEPEQRAFKPHLTLARARDPGGDAALASCAAELAEVDCGQARIDALVLYRSDLSRSGPRYTALARPALGAQ